MSGYPAKRIYSGEKGLYMEFYTSSDAQAFYAKAKAKGNRVEIEDNIVTTKFSQAAGTT